MMVPLVGDSPKEEKIGPGSIGGTDGSDGGKAKLVNGTGDRLVMVNIPWWREGLLRVGPNDEGN